MLPKFFFSEQLPKPIMSQIPQKPVSAKGHPPCTVILRYADRADERIVLHRMRISDITRHIPSYEELAASQGVTLREPNGPVIVTNKALQSTFIANNFNDLTLEVITGQRPSAPRRVQQKLSGPPNAKDYRATAEITESFESSLIRIEFKKKRALLRFPQDLEKYSKGQKRAGGRNQRGKVLSFALRDCAGMNLHKLSRGCMLRFKVERLPKGSGGAQDQEAEFKAVNVRIPFLCHRWQRFDDRTKKWKALTRAQSVAFERKYDGAEQKYQEMTILTEKSGKIRRVTRFKGKVLVLDQNRKCGLVQMNYPEEYGAETGIWFKFRDCRFNHRVLRVGDTVEYNVRVRDRSAVRVMLWIVPYRWQFRRIRDEGEASKWNDLTYHQSIEMENKYNPNGDVDGEEMECVHDGEAVIARRVTTFRSKVVVNRHMRSAVKLALVWARSEDLGLHIIHILTANDRPGIRVNEAIDFRVRWDEAQRKWMATHLRNHQWN